MSRSWNELGDETLPARGAARVAAAAAARPLLEAITAAASSEPTDPELYGLASSVARSLHAAGPLEATYWLASWAMDPRPAVRRLCLAVLGANIACGAPGWIRAAAEAPTRLARGTVPPEVESFMAAATDESA